MRLFVFLACFWFLFASSGNAQQIYKWKDEKGNWRFSDVPPAGTPGVERRSMPASPPYKLRQDESCAPFKVGETRKFKAARPSESFPHLQLLDFQVQRVASTGSYALFSWKSVIKNTSPAPDVVSGSVQLLDCNEFLLVEQIIEKTALRPGEDTTLTGNLRVGMDVASRVGRFSGSFGGSSKGTQELSGGQVSHLKPAVRVIATNLSRARDSDIYFSGEVYNTGGAIAHNVKVFFTIKNESGIPVESNSVSVEPADLKPGGSGIFQKKVSGMISNPGGHSWFSEVEWSE